MYFNALTLHSLGRRLKAAHLPFLPRLCESLTYLIFNCSIPLTAAIGEGSRCEHRGIGVVINRQAKIGRRCRIHAHVVVGGAGAGRVGTPTIGDDVTLGAGCKILGSITIGDGAQVGANAVVLQDVPAGAVAVGVPARIVGDDSGNRILS